MHMHGKNCKKHTGNTLLKKTILIWKNKIKEKSKCAICLNSTVKCFVLSCIKMNEIVNNFLLAGDKFMPELYLKQPGFTYSACGPYTRNKEKIEKFMQTGNTDFIYKNEIDKACFQHYVPYGISKDLTKRT